MSKMYVYMLAVRRCRPMLNVIFASYEFYARISFVMVFQVAYFQMPPTTPPLGICAEWESNVHNQEVVVE